MDKTIIIQKDNTIKIQRAWLERLVELAKKVGTEKPALSAKDIAELRDKGIALPFGGGQGAGVQPTSSSAVVPPNDQSSGAQAKSTSFTEDWGRACSPITPEMFKFLLLVAWEGLFLWVQMPS